MKRAGWLGFVLIGAGGLLIWAGYQGVSIVAVLRSILNNEPLPATSSTAPATSSAAPATTGSSGGSGFAPGQGGENAKAGQGGGGGGGGGW